MAFKLVISDPKSGMSVQKEASDDALKGFIGLKIGDSVKGELIDLTGYEFLLTGGSDYCGFPMRKDVPGIGRKKILAFRGVGVRKLKKGILQRKTVCGNTVHAKTSQINLKVVKQGTENIFAEAGKKSKEDKADKKDEKVEKKAEAKTEEKGETKTTAATDKKEVQQKAKKEDVEKKKEVTATNNKS